MIRSCHQWTVRNSVDIGRGIRTKWRRAQDNPRGSVWQGLLGVCTGVCVDICVDICQHICVDICVGRRKGKRKGRGVPPRQHPRGSGCRKDCQVGVRVSANQLTQAYTDQHPCTRTHIHPDYPRHHAHTPPGHHNPTNRQDRECRGPTRGYDRLDNEPRMALGWARRAGRKWAVARKQRSISHKSPWKPMEWLWKRYGVAIKATSGVAGVSVWRGADALKGVRV